MAAAAAFQPPPAASPHPPAWRSTASAADAALEAQRDQRATSTAEGNKRRTNLTTQRCQNHAERRDVADAPVQQMQQAQQVQRMQRMQSVQSVPEHNEQRAEQRTEMAEKFQNSSAPNSSPSARTPRPRILVHGDMHRFKQGRHK